MDAFKIAVKIFTEQDDLSGTEFVPIFHRWIQAQAFPDHLLIDVADYAHVPAGPGTVLVSRQANLYTDRTANRLGLLYVRKLPLEGGFRDRLRKVISAALAAAAKLEAEPDLAGRIKFRTDELLIRVHDRLLAPNTPETFAAARGDIQAVADAIYGSGAASLEFKPNSLTLFEVHVKARQSPTLKEIISKL